MRNYKVKPSGLDFYMKNKTPEMESAVKGQFYELYCYNEVIKNKKDISIIKANYVERKAHGNFSYSQDGKIIYFSREIYLAEFDIIGIKENTILWWEITKSSKIDKKGIIRKSYLLNRIFENLNITFTIIIPEYISEIKNYNYEIIEEPEYTKYFDQQYFKFDKIISKCISIAELNNLATNYDYIDEIITLSYGFYNNEANKIIEELKNNYLIERVYNIDMIKTGRFDYYDLRSNIKGFIEIHDNSIFLDGRLLKNYGKTKHEIITLLKRLEYKNQ